MDITYGKITDSYKLKFGIDRLLSTTKSDKEKMLVKNITKPLAIVAVPCSDCVTSLFRCCCLSPSNNYQDISSFHHQFISISSSSIYTVQPIKPFAKRLSDDRNPLVSKTTSHNLSSNFGNSKRKRSWSRAVFSNLQRKGLEKRFQLQKYITKPDRRQLAATLGLTDAQVKVWFQNRRMKWRHSKEIGKGNETVESIKNEDKEIDIDNITENE